jgi:hypothetical protein
MPIGTPTSLGTPTSAGSTTVNFTTSVTAPSDSLLIAIAFWGHSSDKTATMATTGLTWGTAGAPDHTNTHVFGYTFRVGIFSAPAASGLASGATIALTGSAPWDGALLAAYYVTGMDLTGTREDTSAGTGASGTAWNTGSASTTNADDLVIGGSMIDGATSSTATGSATELNDWQFATNSWTGTTAYRIESSAGSKSLTGTWVASANHVEGFAAYKSGSPPAPEQMPEYMPLRMLRRG